MKKCSNMYSQGTPDIDFGGNEIWSMWLSATGAKRL
jgi:hypothetical protein